MTTQTLQQTLTKAWHSRIGRLVGVSFSLVVLVSAVISYRAANVPASAGRTMSTRSEAVLEAPVVPVFRSTGSTNDRPSDALIPECMIHVCVQSLAAPRIEPNIDELIPECMIHVCMQPLAVPSVERNTEELIQECMIHVCVPRLAAPGADHNTDALIPECMIHVCVQRLAASVYDDR